MRAIPPPADGGEGGADADAELARQVVEWLSGDDEGRDILRALVERPAVGAAALSRRLQRAAVVHPAAASVVQQVLVGRRVEVLPSPRPESSLRTAGARGLARLLPLAGMGLLLGGFVAFMLGVLTLGLRAPGYSPLFGFGITLILLAAASIAAGRVLAHRGRPRLGRASRMLITLAVVVVAVSIATAVAGLLEG
jgi:hypothetical protein